MIDGACPNCGVEIIPNRGGDTLINSVNGINRTDDFVTKAKKMAKSNLFEVKGCEIGHGYAVFEFKWAVDARKLDEHLTTYRTSIYQGIRHNWNSEKHIVILDDGYDVTKPSTALPKPALEKADTVAPNEKEEQSDNGKDT
jgi:hypothetical protein